METVDLIASGYEWECPNCEEVNREIEFTDTVCCGKCGGAYETKSPEHAWE